jgi:hypothetical protein
VGDRGFLSTLVQRHAAFLELSSSLFLLSLTLILHVLEITSMLGGGSPIVNRRGTVKVRGFGVSPASILWKILLA